MKGDRLTAPIEGVMRAIVLVKQVPDLRVGAVAMKPDGTIDRSSSRAITNPADLHALEAALQLAEEVWAVSMGPPNAEAALRSAVAMGAKRAVLLCDRLFAGSDTWATANALSAAITHLGGAEIVLAGVSALDGETGHVGPQVAERLGLHLATTCEDLSIEGDTLIARRIIEGGYELVVLPLPALVTIAETGFEPRYPTLPGRKRAISTKIETLTASDIGLDVTRVGLTASPTKVSHMESVALGATDCRFVGDGFSITSLARVIVEHSPRRTDRFAHSRQIEQVEKVPGYEGSPGIWVVGEVEPDGGLARVSCEILSKASELASLTHDGVAALIVGAEIDRAADDASLYGADMVMTFRDERLKFLIGRPEARIISDSIRRGRPEIVLFGATTSGRNLAPRIACMLDTGIAADCTGLYISDWERRGRRYERLLHQVRPAMGGGVLATCLCPEARPQMATIRAGVFAPLKRPKDARRLRLESALTEDDFDVEILEREIQRTGVTLADADVVVAGGAGCGTRNWHLVESLASALGGRVAASRAAVEAGLAPRSYQVGQTGTTVSPQLYIACGISGALQHVVGMQASRIIVAINRDEHAPIFHFAHYGVVGDVAAVLPRLTAAIESEQATAGT